MHSVPMPPQRAAWLHPKGCADATARGSHAVQASFNGPVAGAWGGVCQGSGQVHTAEHRFSAELALAPGSALNAAITAGAHFRGWVRMDDPQLPCGAPLQATLTLSMAGELACDSAADGGWGDDPRVCAFLGAEDHARRPLMLRMAPNPRQPGLVHAHEQHAISLPNGRWAPLLLRFATRVQCSLSQTLRWTLHAQATLYAASVQAGQLRHCTDEAEASSSKHESTKVHP